MATLSDLAIPKVALTCRYHPKQALLPVGVPYALLAPPPHQVIPVDNPGAGFETFPASMPVDVWYCPLCSYLELHYRPIPAVTTNG